MPTAPEQRIGAGEPRHGVLSDAESHGPHPLRGPRRTARTRRAIARGLILILYGSSTLLIKLIELKICFFNICLVMLA